MKKYKISGVNKYYYHQKLNNGLDVYLYPDRHTKNYYLTFSTRFGGTTTDFKKKSEKDFHHIQPGTAHFLEHQLFERGDGKSAFDFFNKLGANANAYTSSDITCYEVTGTTNIYKNLIYLIDYVQSPNFTEEGVEKEKGIIIEEIKRYQDNVGRNLITDLYESLFHQDNARISNIGTEEDVKSITVNDLKLSYEYFYHPNNMQIVIAGNFNIKKTMELIEKNQNQKKFSKPEKIIIDQKEEPNTVFKKTFERKMNIETPNFVIASKIPLSNFKSLKLKNYEIVYYLSLALKINFGSTSLICQKLWDEQLILGGLSPILFFTKKHIVIGIRNVSKYPGEIIDLIRNEMSKIMIEKADYQRTKKVILSNYISDFDYVDSIVNNILEDIILIGKPYDDYINYVKKDDYETLLKVISKIDLNNHSTIIIKPKKDNN